MVGKQETASAVHLPVPPIQLQVLGQFEVKVQRQARTHLLTYDKPRLLLAMLALAGGNPIARGKLVELLWPELSETQGKARMRHALHVLRQALAPCADLLVVHSDRLALHMPGVQVDIALMLDDGPGAIDDELCLALFRGELLDDLRARIVGPLDEWFEPWRQALSARMDQCRARLVSGWLASNQLRDALRHARHWVQVWPREESCYRILIEVLVRTGRYEEARKVYGQCRATLAADLATSPDPALEALIANLPLSHALHAEVDSDGTPPRFRPLAVLAIALDWQFEDAGLLADSDALQRLDRACAAIRRRVQQHGGWMAPSGANQFIAYLGYPGVSAVPAMRAAELARALLRRELPAGMRMRIGLHADLGLCSPGGMRPDNGYLLAQTALAVLAQAQPGEVIISAQAQRRLPGYDIHDVQREGVLCRVLGQPRLESVSRMVGRTREFTALVSAWRSCLTDRRTLTLTLCGVAGYGKSLLAAALAAQAGQARARVIWLRCFQDLQEQPLHPLRLWLLEHLPEVMDEASDEDLAAVLNWPVHNARILRSWLLCEPDIAGAALAADIPRLASMAMMSITRDPGALLIVLDDAHWADSITQSWMRVAADMQLACPMMVLVVRRPDGAAIAANARLDLAPLDARDVANLLSHHARATKLGRDLHEAIGRQAHGNPRLAALMLDQAAGQDDIERPPAMRDIVCAQLWDVDAQARQIAYLCALYDAPLPIELAAQLVHYDRKVVADIASGLRAASILLPHLDDALVCPVLVKHAIESLMAPAQAAQLSQRIAQYLLEQDEPQIRVAPFLERAGDRRAPLWWRGAAMDALHTGQLHEAGELVARALRTKDAIADETEREQFVFECQLLRGAVVSALSGPAHPEAMSSYGMAAEMRRAGDVQTMIVALWARWTTAQNTGAHTLALRLAQQLMQTAKSLQDASLQGWAAYAIAQHYLWRGLGGEAETLLCEAGQLLREVPLTAPSPFGIQTSALVPASLAMAYGLQGKYAPALSMIERATAEAMRSNAWVAVLLCQLAQARIHYLAGDMEQAVQAGEYLMACTGGQSQLTTWHAIATGYAMLGRVLRAADAAVALEAMEAALPLIRSGMPVSVDGHLCLLARAYIAMGDLDRARDLLDEAQALGAAHGSSSLQPEILCLRGDSLAAQGDVIGAQGCWQQARMVADAVGLAPYAHWADERLARQYGNNERVA
ncbi:BTAD domain-containing putative transcriptional regulator [Bordetella sp. 02P26C-1]|uniref:BTAD domain-containing putative transcriptional regulator n=1 Tax=Bordetella sp. 02P26C-1 TaxID=2683195 RepID=UPI001353B6D7|nr:BTAD domain-containing putative transcriptional regulator [Bordetella sp. 02P26C-1]MVW80340.1 AAA family ATPase [Bordetella sp. 02P26C-1]